jgi:sugar transferase (PEP-CTERM system associated)
MSSPRQTLCALGDSVILVLSMLVAAAIRFHSRGLEALEYDLLVPKAILVAFVIEVCFYYCDLYEVRRVGRRFLYVLRFAQAFLIAAVLLTLTYYALPFLTVGRGLMALHLTIAFVAIQAWRALYLWANGKEALGEVVLVVGTGSSAQQIAREMLARDPMGFRIVGFLGEHQAEVGRRLVNPSVIGTISEVSETIARHRVSLIIVALEDRRRKMPVGALLQARMRGVRVEEGPEFYERLTGKIPVANLRPSWLVFSPGFRKPRVLKSLKASAEFMAAVVMLALAAPALVVIALLIRLESAGPVLYRQDRVGELGRTFRLFKFRTMMVDAEAASGPVWAAEENDPRITRLGRWLRKLRLDELPQLFNVVRGEMSFVGPRPERPHFVGRLGKIIPYYDERHTVKPGITGWAQVKFRYGSTIEDAEEKLQYDLYYIKHMSPAFDLAIIFDTLKVMVLSRGAR